MHRMTVARGLRAAGLLWLAGSVGAIAPASADTVADFYRETTVTILVGGSAGGNHNHYSSLLHPFVKKYLPGQPTIIVKNMPGAGGTKAANYLYNVAPQDGSVIGIVLADTPSASRLRATGVRYDPKKFQYIAGADRTVETLAVWKSTGVLTIEDAKKKEVLIGASGKSSKTYVIPTLMNAILGTRFKVIVGYKGMTQVELAMERGELEGRHGVWASMKSIHPDWVSQDRVAHLVVADLKPEKELPNVPLLADLAPNAKDRKVLELISGNAMLGRCWLAPPAVPADRMAALRESFWKALHDPRMLEQASKRKMPIVPIPWQALQARATQIAETDAAVIERARELMGLKEKKS
jgi:tripartite-type tricarboxylate transporter receptor subunit TctC